MGLPQPLMRGWWGCDLACPISALSGPHEPESRGCLARLTSPQARLTLRELCGQWGGEFPIWRGVWRLVAEWWPRVCQTGSCLGVPPVSLLGFLTGSHGAWLFLGGIWCCSSSLADRVTTPLTPPEDSASSLTELLRGSQNSSLFD